MIYIKSDWRDDTKGQREDRQSNDNCINCFMFAVVYTNLLSPDDRGGEDGIVGESLVFGLFCCSSRIDSNTPYRRITFARNEPGEFIM